MALNGIDTASYQAGLNPAKVPMDFNIVKATQGVSYLNPDFARMAKATADAGKLIGIYHYGSGNDPVKEADFFLRNIPGYIGKAILCLDWERDQNPAFGKNDVSWCKSFCDRVYKKTGVRCFIYMSKSVCRAHDWSSLAKNHPLWGAQYPNYNRTGYQSNPWTDSNSWGAWSGPTIFQYTSSGQLYGWSARLDLDLAYLTADEWKAYAKGKMTVTVKYPEKTDNDLAIEVLFGAHGNDEKRKASLGNRYDGTQQEVNRLVTGSNAVLLTTVQQYLKKWGCDNLV